MHSTPSKIWHATCTNIFKVNFPEQLEKVFPNSVYAKFRKEEDEEDEDFVVYYNIKNVQICGYDKKLDKLILRKNLDNYLSLLICEDFEKLIE